MQKELLKALESKFPWVGLRFISEKSQVFSAQDGKSKAPTISLDQGVQVEVRSKDLTQISYACTSDLSKESLLNAAGKAYEQAEIMSQHGLAPLPAQVRPLQRGSYQSSQVKPIDTLSRESIVKSLNLITATMKSRPSITKAFGDLVYTQRKQLYITQDGTEIEQTFDLWNHDYSCVAQEGSQIQRRSLFGGRALCQQSGLEALDEPWLLEQSLRAADEAHQLLLAQECPKGFTNLVLAPDQMLLQIHESIGHPLELDRILGDERNYAGWSFVTLKDFGSLQFGSPLLNVVFDPQAQNGFASYAFDEAGSPAQKEYLIKNGVLLRPLGASESQSRSGLPGVANFRSSSWNRAPIDRMANIDIEPGTTSFESMISNIEDGIFMKSNNSWSIDDYRNKFQFGCEIAYKIENGKLTKVLKNPNYRGECLKFWNSLKQVGDASTFQRFGSPYCGKGEPSQVIRVSHASPVCYFENIEVFGGH